MATARCYTKSGSVESGSVEKYESNLWSSPISGNWSSLGILGTITTPDPYGNYTVTPAPGYEDSNTQTGFYCYTMYGGVRKTFYFKKSNIEIWLTAGIGHQEKGLLVVYLAFGNNEYLGNDKLNVNVRITADNPMAFITSVCFIVDKNSEPSLVRNIYKDIDMNRTYTVKIDSCNPMGGKNYKVIIRN